MRPIDVITSLKKVKGRSEKKAILLDAYDKCEDFFIGAQLVFDKSVKFGIRAIPEIQDIEELDEDDYGDPADFTFKEFMTLANKLQTKQLTSKDAKKALNEAASVANVFEWNLWYRRILLKSLQCGLSIKILDDVVIQSETMKQSFNLLESNCMITIPGANSGVILPEVFNGERYLDPNLNGKRVLTIVDRKNAKIYQENPDGSINEDYSDLAHSLNGLLTMLPTSMVLDGEIINRSYTDLMVKETGEEIYYALYDFLTLTEYRRGRSNKKLAKRHQQLLELLPAIQTLTERKVYIVPKFRVNIKSEKDPNLVFFVDEIKDAGFSSYIVKDVNGFYTSGNINDWFEIPV